MIAREPAQPREELLVGPVAPYEPRLEPGRSEGGVPSVESAGDDVAVWTGIPFA